MFHNDSKIKQGFWLTLNTEIVLEETVIELLFEFGVSPFQFGCFIEGLGKVKMGH